MSLSRAAAPLLTLFLAHAAHAAPSLVAGSGNALDVDDLASGALTVVADPSGDPSVSHQIGGLTTQPGSGVVYGLDLVDFPNQPVQLQRFDDTGKIVASRTLTYQGQVVELAEGLSFAPDGRLWITFHFDDQFSFQSGHLGTVDPASGVIDPASVVLLSNGTQDDGDMLEFVGRTLYLGDNTVGLGTWLFTVDLATGSLTTIGEVVDAAGAYQLTDLAWDGTRLFAETFTGHGDPGTGELIRVDPRTAAATAIGPAGGRDIVDGITFATLRGQGGGGHDHDCDDDDDHHHHGDHDGDHDGDRDRRCHDHGHHRDHHHHDCGHDHDNHGHDGDDHGHGHR